MSSTPQISITIHHSIVVNHQNSLIKIIIASVLLFISYHLLPAPVIADELSSDRFVIQLGKIHLGSQQPPTTTIKQKKTSNSFSSSGYRLNSGFTHLPNNEPFSFSFSPASLNFGTLFPNTFYRQKLSLEVNGRGVPGYQVSLIENHSPTLPNSHSFIPDTSCDPSSTCTLTISTPWTLVTSHGFGYHVADDPPDHYRPLPNNAKNQEPVSIISRSRSESILTTDLTLALTVSPTQDSGLYQNSVQLLALPGY